MKTISQDYRAALSNYTTQRKGRIQVDNTYYDVFNVEYYADCYEEGNIVGNAISTQLSFDMLYQPKFDEFSYYEGVWTGEEYEYLYMGNFTVFDEKDTNEFKKHIVAFDNLIKFNGIYVDDGIYPKTMFQLLENICSQANITLNNISIPNGDFVIEDNQFVNNETLKTVLKAICSINGCYAVIKNDGLTLQLKNTTTEEIDKSYHQIVDWKRRTYGINQVIIGMKDVDGEYVIRQDNEDIELNGVHKLVVNDNPFAYTQEKREDLIEELYNQVRGFGYVPYELKGEWLPHLEIGDTITIDDIDTIVLRINAKSPNAVESEMSAPAIIDSAVEYADNTNDIENRLKNTQIQVNKATGTINFLTEIAKTLSDELGNTYTIEQVNDLIQNAETGLTNTFKTSGGNNIFRNTGLWFKTTDNSNPYEFWTGNVVQESNDKALNNRELLLQTDTLVQEQEIPNGKYTISFKYKKLIPLASVYCSINDVDYELVEEDDTEFIQTIDVSSRHINIKFVSDADNSCEIYDLMVNVGETKYAYSQNQNETTTNTVNISKGITISSTDSDTTFKADADGIRTLDKGGNELSKFTDKGMVNKEMIIENQAEIVGVLIQQVGDQTWFTRM